MPFERCIGAALADQLIDSDRAAEMRETHAQIEAALREQMTPQEAAAEASRLTFREFEQEAGERRRQTFLTLAAQKAALERLDGFRDPIKGNRPDPARAALGYWDKLLPGRNGHAIEEHREYWRGAAFAEMDKALLAYKRTALLGRMRTPANELAIIAEAFGRGTNDVEAKAVAAGWKAAHEMLRSAFNRFGGHIGALQDFGFPTIHSRRAINAVSAQEWKDFIWPLLDRARITTRTGARPLTDRELSAALDDMYSGIVTDNWDARIASSRAGGRALGNRRDLERFLHFNSPDGWLAYQRRFGEGNVFDTMVHHIEALSRDVALMQETGPNPRAFHAWMKSELLRRAEVSRDQSAIRTAKRYTKKNGVLDGLMDHYTGEANAPHNRWMAEFLGDVRNVVSGSLLHFASITAIPTDMNFSRMTRAMNGVPQVRALAEYTRLLASKEHRMAAIRAGLGAQGYATVLGDNTRIFEQIAAHQWSRWYIDRALTWNGLLPHTEALRWSFGLAAQGVLADVSKTPWRALDKTLRGVLERYRIGEAEWDDIRVTPLHNHNGATYLRARDIADRTNIPAPRALELAQKVNDWILTETEFAVPSSSLAARAASRGPVAPGSLLGVISDSLLLFKTFGLTYLFSHGRRMLAQASWQKRAQYLASLLVMNTIAGAAVLQLRAIANGRDPRDMTEARFWAAAFFAGGGAGMIGDFLYSQVNEADRGIGSYLMGPTVGMVQDAGKTVSSGFSLAFGDPRKRRARQSALANNSIGFVKRYLNPFGLFTTAIERAMFDTLQEHVDPNWKQRLKRVEQWHQRQFGQESWWRRGEALPQRAPNVHAATGAKP